MAELALDGATIHYQEAGDGDPLVLVHGSWDEHTAWRRAVPLLAGPFRVVTYDRRGHGTSHGGGPLDADAEDLGALIEHVGAPAHVAANSLGASIALRLAARRPGVFRTLALHEPPLLGLLGDGHPAVAEVGRRVAGVVELLEAGRAEEGARKFADDVALGPGAWEAMPVEDRQLMVRNAHTFLEENQDETVYAVDVDALADLSAPVLLSGGDQSPPFFGEVLDALERAIPTARRRTIEGAGHLPHETHPDVYAEMLRDFAAAAA